MAMSKPNREADLADVPRQRVPRQNRQTNGGQVAPRKPDARAALLAAASDLLKERGGIEPPVAEIAAKAQLNAGLIGYYFGGKDGLFLELLERDFGKGLIELEKLLAAPIPVIEKLKSNIAGMINVHFRTPYINQLILTLVERSSPEVSKMILDKWIRPVYEAHARLLDEGYQSGELRKIDPMFYYYTVLGACGRIFAHPYSLTTLFGIQEITRDRKQQFIAHATQMLLPGLLTDEALKRYAAQGDSKTRN